MQAAPATRVVVRALPSPSACARAPKQREAPPNAAHPRELGEGCGAVCKTHAHRPFAGRTHHSRGCACPARLTQSVPTHAIREKRKPIAAVAHVELRPRVESWHGHEARCRPHPPLAWSCVPCRLPLLVLAHKDRERHRQTPLIPVSSAKAAGPCARRTHTAPSQAAPTTRVVVRALPAPPNPCPRTQSERGGGRPPLWRTSN